METVYLTADLVIALHDWIMKRMTGVPGELRDWGLLDSALQRPRNLAYYNPDADLVAQAVVLAIGISQNQPFVDGNKRIAYDAANMFLNFNRVVFTGDPEAFACWLICVAGRMSIEDSDLVIRHLGLEMAAILDVERREVIVQHFEDWLRENVLTVTRS